MPTRNAFWLFVEDVRDLERSNEQLGIQNAQEWAVTMWNGLNSDQLRTQYEENASHIEEDFGTSPVSKQRRLNELTELIKSDTNTSLDCGIDSEETKPKKLPPLPAFERVGSLHRLNGRKAMDQLLSWNYGSDEDHSVLLAHTFCLVQLKFYEIKPKEYALPSEISAVKFSLSEGVIDTFCVIIAEHGTIPGRESPENETAAENMLARAHEVHNELAAFISSDGFLLTSLSEVSFTLFALRYLELAASGKRHLKSELSAYQADSFVSLEDFTFSLLRFLKCKAYEAQEQVDAIFEDVIERCNRTWFCRRHQTFYRQTCPWTAYPCALQSAHASLCNLYAGLSKAGVKGVYEMQLDDDAGTPVYSPTPPSTISTDDDQRPVRNARKCRLAIKKPEQQIGDTKEAFAKMAPFVDSRSQDETGTSAVLPVDENKPPVYSSSGASV